MTWLRWRYAWRDLWLHKSRTVLVILSIAVGVFAFGIISGAASTLNNELPVNYLAVDPASITIFSTPVDDAMVDAVARMPEVAVAQGRRGLVTQFLTPAGDWHDLQLYALDDWTEQQVDIIYPYQGAWPPPENQVLIERNSLGIMGLAVGDELLLETPDGVQRRLPIAGLTHDMNQPPAQITDIPYGYIDRETLVWLGEDRTFDELHVLVADGRFDKAHIYHVATAVTDKMERAGETVFWAKVPTPGEHFVMDFLPTILLILGALGVMALILSGFLVINVITAILTQQIRQIGVMKAVGARAFQVTGLYLRMVLVFGVLALFISVPLGILGAFAFSRFIAGQLNFDILRPEVSPLILTLQIAVGLLVPVLAALAPIMATARITVREAVQDQGLAAGGGDLQPGNPLYRLQKLVPLSRPMRLSMRNTFRRRGRLIRTLIPLALGGAVFMTVLSVRASLFLTLEETLVSQGYDVQLRLDRPYQMERIEFEAARTPGVAYMEGWNSRDGVPIHADGTEGDSVLVQALPPETRLFTPAMVAGRWLAGPGENDIVVPTSFLAEEPDTKLGSEVVLKIQGEESTWRVVGVNQRFQPPIAPAIVYVNQADFWRELGGHGMTDNVRVITTAHDPATHLQVANELEDRLQQAGIEVRSIRTASADRAMFTERFNIITTILIIMAVLLATVGSLGLMGTMSINVLERKREVGVMRAIGASTRTVLQIVIAEGVVIGVLSWVGGFILSHPMSRFLSREVGMTFAKLPLTYVYDFSAPLLWLLIVVLVSAGASFLPARNAAAVSVRETLAYE